MTYALRGPLVKNLLGAYLDAGGKGVIVGTDSHWLWQFEGGWERAVEYLRQAGLSQVVLFRGRRPRRVDLAEEESAERGDTCG